ncbi:MAG: 6-carboxytetrahydropterin synthase [Lachnospiraceae bacterium]|nr:6-carboxytetrahydropterin synthase [Lachnospiraceae bacterium]
MNASNTLYREYRFKFYLNANHYIIINGKAGQNHPHTWEFVVQILVDNDEFIQFDQFETAIDEYFDKYQNKVMNDIPPFDHTVPTLENIADYFIYDIREIVHNLGGTLMKMECSETPTRAYVISFEQDRSFIQELRRNTSDKINTIIDDIVDDIMEE